LDAGRVATNLASFSSVFFGKGVDIPFDIHWISLDIHEISITYPIDIQISINFFRLVGGLPFEQLLSPFVHPGVRMV
jgi:hypothetical protein